MNWVQVWPVKSFLILPWARKMKCILSAVSVQISGLLDRAKEELSPFFKTVTFYPLKVCETFLFLKKISNAETMHGWFFSKKTLGNVLTEPLFTVLVRIKNLNLANLSISFDEVEVMVVGMRVFGSVRLELCVLKRLEMIAWIRLKGRLFGWLMLPPCIDVLLNNWG